MGLEVLRRRAGVDPVAIGGQGEESASLDHRRERLALDRDAPLAVDAVEHRRLEDVGARVDHVGGRPPRLGLLDEGKHPTVRVGRHDAEPGRVVDRCEADRRLRPSLAVEADQRAHVEVREDVAVHDQKGVVDPTVGRGEGDGAGGVQRRGLHGVAEPDPPRPVLGKGAEEGVRPVAEGQQRLLHAVGGEMGEHALDHGLLDHGEQLLGDGVGEGSKARSLAPDQHDSPHDVRPYREAGGRPAAR